MSRRGGNNGQCRLAAGFIVFRICPLKKLEYLLLQMRNDHSNWAPPKGHLESNETDMEGVERETKEETGFEPQDYQVFPEYPITLNYMARGRPKEVKFWPALLKNFDTPIRLSKEHQNWKWLSITEACDLANWQDMKEALVKCDTFCRAKFNL